MEEIILDSSVLIKLFSKDEDYATTAKLIAKFASESLSLVLLDVALYELINALKYSKNATSELISAIVDAVIKMNPRMITFSPEVSHEAIQIMEKFSITIYDSLFIAAAQLENVHLLTADYKHHRQEISPSIIHFRKWM